MPWRRQVDFREADQNRIGSITAHEFACVLQDHGIELGLAQLKALNAAFGTPDRRVQYVQEISRGGGGEKDRRHVVGLKSVVFC